MPELDDKVIKNISAGSQMANVFRIDHLGTMNKRFC